MNQQTNSNNSLEHQLIPVLLNNGKEGLKHLLCYQLVTKGLPVVLRGTLSVIQGIVNTRMKRHIEKVSNLSVKKKTSSVVLQRDYEKDSEWNLLFDAVLSYVSELPQTKHVKRTTTGVFIMASTDEIEMSPCIFVRKVGEVLTDEKISKLTIEVYSYTYDLGTLRKYMEDIEEKYQMAMSNQLGKNIFYFDEVPFALPFGLNRKPDLTKAPPRLIFSKYPLHTNKSLKNIYGDSVKIIRKRVDFFVNNKRWYEEKGVPYTLGLLLHGVPGAGKTSCIKSIAKDTNRHVLNIRLSENTTVNQLNALFYSSQVQVLQNGENKFFDIPIDKRIIVLEDVDCLTDVVLSREAAEEVKALQDKTIEEDQNTNKGNDFDPYGRRAVPTGGVSGESQKLNLSILLNILDGVLEQPGRILIMTSNHPEKLDKALVRPGRIDVIVKFDYCKRHEVVEIIEAFTGKKVNSQLVNEIADAIYTPAEVTRVIFENIESIVDITKNLSGHDKVDTHKNNDEIKNVPLIIDEQEQSKEIKEYIVQPIVIQQETNNSNVDDTYQTVHKEDSMYYNLNPQINIKTPENPFDNMFNSLNSNNECFLDELFNTSIVVK